MGQKKTDNASEKFENIYKRIFENANDGIILHDLEGNIIDVNQTMYKRLGYTKEEMLTMPLSDLVTPDFAKMIKSRVKKLRETGVAVFESADKRKDGTFMHVEVSARLVDYKGRQIIQSIVRDINDRKMAEELILSTLREKDTLLKEVQTRAQWKKKIFLMILENLSRTKGKEKLHEAIDAAQKRIESIAFIQEKIFRSPNFSKVDMPDIVRSLVTHLYALYQTGVKDIRIHRDIDVLSFDVRRTVSCSLLIYEMLSNSLKHAFPDGKKGKIFITLKKQGRRKAYLLSVKDSGIGIPVKIDIAKAQTTGMCIIRDLIEGLEGQIQLRRKNGTELIVKF